MPPLPLGSQIGLRAGDAAVGTDEPAAPVREQDFDLLLGHGQVDLRNNPGLIEAQQQSVMFGEIAHPHKLPDRLSRGLRTH